MRNILAVAGKELRSYFHSPIGYLVLTIYSIVCGYFFYVLTAGFVMESLQMQMEGGAMPLSLNERIIRPLFAGILTIVVAWLLMPLISMRLFPEEKRTGTIELLLTSPLTDLEMILGKFFGGLALY